MSEKREVIIIGSGPAGLTAAIYAARANLKPIVLAGIEPGGQLMTTTDVENYPGFAEGVKGPELMQNMIKQAERFGAEMIYEKANEVEFTDGMKKVKAGEKEYSANSIIIASGSSPKRLGLDSEQKFWGKGVSTCATCDGAFYKDKVVAVVGGGDSAAEESTFLTKFAKKVYVVHRRDKLRASKIMQQRMISNEKIEMLWNREVKEILGDNTVSKLKLVNNQTEEESDLAVDGLFLAIGHIPNNRFLKGAVDLDNKGYVKVLEGTKTNTNVKGVFVAGDIHDYHYQQAITAAGMGCMAAMDAEAYLATLSQ